MGQRVLSFDEATSKGARAVKKLADKAKDGTVFIGDDAQPEIAVVEIEVYEARRREQRDLALATGRVLTRAGAPESYDDVLQRFDVQEKDLPEPPRDLRKYQK